MAKLSAGIAFTGKIGNVSAYKMRGVEGIILRSKGGASKEKIQTLPGFENTRKVNAEFGGRGCASKWVMRAVWPHKALALAIRFRTKLLAWCCLSACGMA